MRDNNICLSGRDIMDRLEINYELVEKVIMDIKRQSVNKSFKRQEDGSWYYYCYENLTKKEFKYITKALNQRYNIKVIDSCLSYDLFNIPHTSFKLHIES